MTGRRVGRLLLLVLAVAIGYWIYKDRPTLQGLIDSITDPLMGSHAAVKSSERNRVVGEATTAISEGTDATVGTLREGMTSREIRELLGEPDKVVPETADGVDQSRWIYSKLKRVLVMRDGRLTSIVIL